MSSPQVLAEPGVLERFLNDSNEIELIRSTQAGQYNLELVRPYSNSLARIHLNLFELYRGSYSFQNTFHLLNKYRNKCLNNKVINVKIKLRIVCLHGKYIMFALL